MALDDLRQKMIDFANSLLQQTIVGKAAWTPTDDEEKYLFAGTRASVTIESFIDRDGDRQSTLSLMNSQGVIIDSLKCEWIDHGGGSFEGEYWNAVLDELFTAARRTAYNVDDAIASLLVDIEKGNQAPPSRAKKNPRSDNNDPWASDTGGYSDEPPF